MINRKSIPEQIIALAAFRACMLRFLRFSEQAASRVGLLPQQHQLLLQIAGAPAGKLVTVAYLAERLQLRHHSAVELCKRCEAGGLVLRTRLADNRRFVVLELTASGRKLLDKLSTDHTQELTALAPELIASLHRIAAPAAGRPRKPR